MTGFDLLADKIRAVHRAIYPGIGDHTDTTINICDSDGDGNNNCDGNGRQTDTSINKCDIDGVDDGDDD